MQRQSELAARSALACGVQGVQMATACQAAGLEGFPTWVMPDGTKLVGEQTFSKLESALDDAAAAAAVAAQLQAAP